MASQLSLVSAILATSVVAQQIGKLTPEIHPSLPTWECTLAGGCVQKNTSVVLDSDYRWTHTADGSSCKFDGLNTTICPDAKTCASNCAVEGVDYAASGVFTNGSDLILNLFVNSTDGTPTVATPRVYLLANDTTYDMFSLLDREFTFDVDVSKLPCGSNGALFFSEMESKGGQSAFNQAGAGYGTGYCDAQCPTPAFINGEANINKHGACCAEMDIWEANSRASSYTPHPCNITGLYKCTGAPCGKPNRYESVCDKDGCDFNAYRLGQAAYYDRTNISNVDTTRPFTVVTQFFTTAYVANRTANSSTETPRGDLREIRRLYVQDGTVIENAQIQVPGIDRGNSITDEFCAQEKKAFGAVNAFAAQGGLKAMGESLRRGMVLVFAVWVDEGSAMKWLDGTWPVGSDPVKQPGTGRGPCGEGEGSVEELRGGLEGRGTQVRFGRVRSGEIGSTYEGRGKGVVFR